VINSAKLADSATEKKIEQALLRWLRSRMTFPNSPILPQNRSHIIKNANSTGFRTIGCELGRWWKLYPTKTIRVGQVSDLQNDIAKLELSVMAARAEYDKIKTVNQQVRLIIILRAINIEGYIEGY
jgi:hypothetical protein